MYVAAELTAISAAPAKPRGPSTVSPLSEEHWLSVIVTIDMAVMAAASVSVKTRSNATQKLGLSSAMPRTNIVYRKAVDKKATKQASGYSHGYQDGAFGQFCEVRNSVPAIRNRIMTSILRIPAGDRKYLLVAKRRLIFTSSSVAVSFCFSLADDDRWYNVPRRPLTGLNPVRVLPSLSLTVATPDDETFAEAGILKIS